MFTTRRRLRAAESRAERLDNYAQTLEARQRELAEQHRWKLSELETSHARSIEELETVHDGVLRDRDRVHADERSALEAHHSCELERLRGEKAIAEAAAETERRRATAQLEIAVESNTRVQAQLQTEQLRIAWTHAEPNRWKIEALNLEATISGSGRWTLLDTRNDRTIIADDYSIIELVATEIAAQRLQTLEARQQVEADVYRSAVLTATDMRMDRSESDATEASCTPDPIANPTNESE